MDKKNRETIVYGYWSTIDELGLQHSCDGKQHESEVIIQTVTAGNSTTSTMIKHKLVDVFYVHGV